ncbi:MAG: DUF1697 domain-containing protein [Geothrix sp.]|uniref:DUF1697 domain-containing protein n=1 Tax=Geothrix sp. TaxID=1962974 RepID=UPI00181322BF|nr:DUF1697 domain-containing protein [Geothrix sp.]NWJ39982.1 DUF1697 domain-containing protein [Geothrix sp.]WIL22007.1 MAG: DUF1697 domain-containing protein [Geothrix sp.]
MSRTFAFLRAINVGGHTVTMAQLKDLFEALGLKRVETFIASGNVVFDGPTSSEAALRKRIEGHLEKALGYEVATFLRSDRELAALVKGCPFSPAEVAEAQALNVAFLQEPLTTTAEARLQGLRTELDAFRTRGREVWWLCQAKQSESTFSNKVFEKALGVKATFRGFSTLQRLAAKYLEP